VILAVVLVLGLFVGIFVGYREAGEPAKRETSSFPWIAIYGSFVPIWVAIWVTMMPEQVGNSLFYELRRRQGEKRAGALDQYLARRFRETPKYGILVGLNPASVAKSERVKGSEPPIVRVVLKDRKEYMLTLVKRNPAVDGKGNGNQWVVEDIRGSEFGE
jgi:hypothetical protein